MNTRDGYYVAPEVLYACEFLERYGQIYNQNFNLNNATEKASKVFTDNLEEDTDWSEFRRMLRSRHIEKDWT